MEGVIGCIVLVVISNEKFVAPSEKVFGQVQPRIGMMSKMPAALV